MLSKKIIKLIYFVIIFFSLNNPLMAGLYDALCDEENCKINVTAKGIEGPSGTIPSTRIVQWFKGGGTELNKTKAALGAGGGGVGGAVIGGIATCWTIVGCVPGIIAGGSVGGISGSSLGESSDYYFTIIGYDKSGKKIMHSFNFVNSRPVAKMTQELTIISGLTEGKLRTYEQIKKLENRNQKTTDSIIKSENNSQLENLPQEINPIKN